MNLLSKKRGMTRLQSFIIYIILPLIILLSLIFFINRISSGKSIEEQVLAKQLALLIDAAKPGTEIILTIEGFMVEISEKEVKVKSEREGIGYSYEFFTPYNIGYEKQDNKLILKVS